MMASNLPRFANYMGLSLCIRYQFDMIHGVSRNRLDDTWFLSVSIQEGIKPPVSICLHWMISLWHLFITQHVVTHAVSIPNKEPTMLIRFYCIVIRSSRMLYMIGIKDISFLLYQISLDLQTTWDCPFACSINLIIQHIEHTLYLVHIPGLLKGIQHQTEQLYCLPLIRLKN